MKQESSSLEELSAELDKLLLQVEFITADGVASFLSGSVAAEVSQLAACHAILRLQAIVEDIPEELLPGDEQETLTALRGMRNRLAHGYSDIDSQVLWTTMVGPLPELIRRLGRGLSDGR